MAEEFLYQQLYEQIKKKIQCGEYAVESRLPTETELEDAFGVSVITVKKALGMLAAEGLVRRIPGKGTFIQAAPHVERTFTARPDRLIGVVLEDVAAPFALSMMYRMDHRAEQAGYKLCIRFSYGDRDKETEEIQFLLSLGVRGLVIMPSHGRHYSPTILKLSIDRYPVILVDKKLNGIPLPSVRTDNADAMAQLVRALAGAGCRRIACLSAEDIGVSSLQERLQGFEETMHAQHLAPDQICFVPRNHIFTDQESQDGSVDAIHRYLADNIACLDAIVCLEYSLIPPLVTAARSLGIVLDRDIRICCVDEDYLSPGGYTFMHVKQNEHLIADTALSLLFERIAGHTIQKEEHLIPATFHDRREAVGGADSST